jgi:CheY-like chemotaxis protein
MIKKVNSVCVIDDDLVYQFLIKEEIEFTNMVNKIIFFDNGEKALEFFEQTLDKFDSSSLPDIIFLDVNMPVMDGWEFLEAYIKLAPRSSKHITIYLVSSSTDVRDFDRAKSIKEVSDYIIKPISSIQLEHIFKAIVA